MNSIAYSRCRLLSREIIVGLEEYLDGSGYTLLSDLVGRAHHS